MRMELNNLILENGGEYEILRNDSEQWSTRPMTGSKSDLLNGFVEKGEFKLEGNKIIALRPPDVVRKDLFGGVATMEVSGVLNYNPQISIAFPFPDVVRDYVPGSPAIVRLDLHVSSGRGQLDPTGQPAAFEVDLGEILEGTFEVLNLRLMTSRYINRVMAVFRGVLRTSIDYSKANVKVTLTPYFTNTQNLKETVRASVVATAELLMSYLNPLGVSAPFSRGGPPDVDSLSLSDFVL